MKKDSNILKFKKTLKDHVMKLLIKILISILYLFSYNHYSIATTNILNGTARVSSQNSNINDEIIPGRVDNYKIIDSIWTIDCRPDSVQLFWVGPESDSAINCKIQRWEIIDSSHINASIADIDTNNWHSIPDFLTYNPLTGNLTDQNFYGISYGDVSGNWQPSKTISLAKKSNDICSKLITRRLFDRIDNQVILTLGVNDVSDIISLEFILSYPSDCLKFFKIKKTENSKHFSLVRNIRDNFILISLAGCSPMNEGGDVLEIVFEIIERDHGFERSDPIMIRKFSLNEVSSNNLDIEILLNEKNGKLPVKFNLFNNYPNPFNTETKIKYQLPEQAKVKMEIFNLLGQRVRVLFDGRKEPGAYQVAWDGKDESNQLVPSGVYFVNFQANEFKTTRKLILMK